MKLARPIMPSAPVIIVSLVMLAVLAAWPLPAGAACKTGGTQCQTNQSCCSGLCIKPKLQHGNAVFGACCTPTACAAQGKNCGTISDGCGHTLSCGSCSAPQTCGGGGTANVCGCTPTTCAAHGANCGSIADGCGGTLNCGTCTAPQTCGGGGVSNQCGCTPIPTCPAGDNCGTVPDGCGGTVNCGACTSPNTCGGGGTPNVCGCTRKACPPAPTNDCGSQVDDGCGGTIDCPCDECFCCCDDDLHPGECVPEGGVCMTTCDPFNGDSLVLCAFACAGVCDSVSLNYLSSSCTLSLQCPPECSVLGGPCIADTDCCPSAVACCGGTCSADPCQ